MHKFFKFTFRIKLYMLRTVPLSTIGAQEHTEYNAGY